MIDQESHQLTPEQYEAKLERRRQALKRRIGNLRAFAKGKDFSLFSEENSGIPLGQPILVGHHSERRHRRHLERIERVMQAGFDARSKADALEQRLDSLESEQARRITSDNPNAKALIEARIERLQNNVAKWKQLRKEARHKNTVNSDTPRAYQITNANAEIKRLKERLKGLESMSTDSTLASLNYNIGDIEVRLHMSQVQVKFPGKPDKATRDVLKRSPLVLKWSRYSGAWVRKHTPTTAHWHFKESLKKALEQATYE